MRPFKLDNADPKKIDKQQEMIHRKFSDDKGKLTRTLSISPVHRGFPVMRDFIFEQLDLFQLSCSPSKRMLPQLKGLSNIDTIDYIVVNLGLHPLLLVPLCKSLKRFCPMRKPVFFRYTHLSEGFAGANRLKDWVEPKAGVAIPSSLFRYDFALHLSVKAFWRFQVF